MQNTMIPADLPRTTKSTSIPNDTLYHIGFGCVVTRVENRTKEQAGTEHSRNNNPFFSDGMGHKRGHTNQTGD